MKPRREAAPHDVLDGQGGSTLIRPPRLGATLLQVAAFNGFGLWLLLGLALAVGVYPAGRGDALVPLTLGVVLVGVGLVAACLHAAWMPTWHGWRIGKGSRPTRNALVALASFLPMLAVAGLARGDNLFWATRLSGAVLALTSLATLIITSLGEATSSAPGLDPHFAAQLPLSRVVSAAYGGGLWLVLCAAGQDSGDAIGHSSLPWITGLLMLALLRGLVEGMRWHALLQRLPGLRAGLEHQPRRYLAATLVYAVPCAALLLASFDGGRLFMAALAAISCMLGMGTELTLYHGALAALPDRR
jgi:sulfite dehydrogenase (quinone) subunit SoeC